MRETLFAPLCPWDEMEKYTVPGGDALFKILLHY